MDITRLISMELLGLLLATYVLYYTSNWYLRRRRMPPGPSGWPILGNRHQLPPNKQWVIFKEWNRCYGPVVSFFLGRTPVIVLGTAQAAWDLLEKRSDIYSTRPRFIVPGEIFSDNKRGFMLPSGEPWKKFRRVLDADFHARKADKYREIQSLESKLLMHQLVHDPKGYEHHVRRFSASVIVSITYGKRVNSVDEWVIKQNSESMAYLAIASIPGRYLVESWPWLLKLPRSLQWFRREPEWQQQRDAHCLMTLLNDVKARVAQGTCPPCLGLQTLDDKDRFGLGDIDVAYILSSPFFAGIESTYLVIITFILAMLHFRDAMLKAQAEIDLVVGLDRMPGFEDRDRLPYVCGLISETMRWRPSAAPTGVPHAVTVDDVYNGMFIPKGSTVYANQYGIMRDPELFPDPELFRPERFINTDNPRLKDFDLPFGFGRRICSGMHLAYNSVYINIVRILWAFDISPSKDADGNNSIPGVWDYTDGFNSRPVRFECEIRPRNEKVKECIGREWDSAQEVLGKWQ